MLFFVCLFVFEISLMFGQLIINELSRLPEGHAFIKLFYAAGAVTVSMR